MNEVRRRFRTDLKQIRETMTDKELFLSKPYHDSLWKLSKYLGGKDRAISLVLSYRKDENDRIAYTDGAIIYVNTANPVTETFRSREEKRLSHEGLIAHECGHLRYTDLSRRRLYLSGFSDGLIYPALPSEKSKRDKRAVAEMISMIQGKDPVAIAVIRKTSAYLSNVLEDVYIESKMCRRYPGSVRIAIQRNACTLVSIIPSAAERNAEGNRGLSCMLDMIFRYARNGKSDLEREYSKEYQNCLKRCRHMIDKAIVSEDVDIRFTTTNHLMIKIWKYIKEEIETTRKQFESELKNMSFDELLKRISTYLEQKLLLKALSEVLDDDQVMTIEIHGWDGTKTEDSKHNASAGGTGNLKGDLPYEKNELLDDLRAEQKELQNYGSDTETGQNLQKELEEAIRESESQLSESLTQAAESRVRENSEQNLKDDLLKLSLDFSLEGLHKNTSIKISRKIHVSDKAVIKYQMIEPEIQRISRHLVKAVEDVLERNEGGKMTGLYMGKRLCRGNLYRQDGKIFEKQILPEDSFNVAFGILIDESGSMASGNRMEAAKKAGVILYDFCKKLGIPVLVYGHSTAREYNGHDGHEIVLLDAAAEFDSVDGNDPIRIMEMDTHGSNRDGMALRFVADRLASRDEEVKILVIISDGKPSAEDYYGEIAICDLQKAKSEIQKKGMKLYAAAIGEDRQQIEGIYRNGFLNISDLDQLPRKLTALLIEYIK